jgi:hypothetical protein
MEVLEMLDRLPVIVDAIQRSRNADPARRDAQPEAPVEAPWKLVATESGHAGTGTARMRNFEEARALAVELSELGFVVAVHDGADRSAG